MELKTKYRIEIGTDKRGMRVAKAVLENWEEVPVRKTKDNVEYFEIRNPYVVVDENSATFVDDELASLFVDRICDAIKSVREGYADALVEVTGAFFSRGVNIVPVVVLDRQKAAELRAEILEKVKDIKLGYRIVFRYGSGLCDFYVADEGKITSFVENSLFIENLEIAKEMVNTFYAKATELGKNNSTAELRQAMRRFEINSVNHYIYRLAVDISRNEVNYSISTIQDIKFPTNKQ